MGNTPSPFRGSGHCWYACAKASRFPPGALVNIKRILHVPGRVMFMQVQRGEVVPVIFNFRSFRDGKTEALKDGNDPVAHQRDGMAAPDRKLITRE